MTRLAVGGSILLAVLGLTLSGYEASAHTPPASHSGDGSVQDTRMPWLDGESRELTQGWNSPFTHRGNNQYATDWGNHGSTFVIYAVAEGDATCTQLDPSWGNFVRVDRIDGPNFDRYAHLASCPFSGTKHFEQGDFIGNAGDTGYSFGIHLHYQKEDSGRTSVPYSLSNWPNFADNLYGDDIAAGQCGAQECHAFISDNAGPGVNLNDLDPPKTPIYTAYANIGHYLCQGNAWDCFGSSADFLNSGPMATYDCLGGSNDCGWNQEFEAQNGDLHNFNWAEACDYAQWVPDRFYTTWLANTWLGQARTPVLDLLRTTYYQFFRHGYLTAPVFGGNADVVPYEHTSCVP